MRFEFDPAKDEANRAKHGITLAIAGELDWDAALVWLDARAPYEETRMIALVPGAKILYYVAFVERGTVTRIISARRATRREVKFYVENFQAS